MKSSTDKLQHELESLMDTGGASVSDLLEALAAVCSEKAIHIEVSYSQFTEPEQFQSLDGNRLYARQWKKVADKIAKLSNSIDL